jgi:hypothetical protein
MVGVEMDGLIRHAAVVAGAALVLLGPAVGVASAAAGAAAGARPAAAARAFPGETWGAAVEGPVSSQPGFAQIMSLSCASAGNCSAGGWGNDSSGHIQAFVVNEVHGTWGTAIEVPGIAALNQGELAFIGRGSVSCTGVGNCSAGGYYTDSSGHTQAFVVSEVHSRWGTAIEVPGTAALNQGGGAAVDSVSCGRPGDCSAGGDYTDSSGHGQAFVISEVHGTWGMAIEVPGTAALNQGGGAGISSVSCGGPGDCSAGGIYIDSSGQGRAFVVGEVHGRWGTAIEVPGIAALNQGGSGGGIYSVSCAWAGDCSAGGIYTGHSGQQAFVVSEVHGRWGTAIEVPGTAALSHSGGAAVNSLSCAGAGDCSAGGYYMDSSGHTQAFVVSEVHGRWRTAIEVPGTAALNLGGFAQVVSVSCAWAGNCSAGGTYFDTSSSGDEQAFVINEVHGVWGRAIEVPGIAALNHMYGQFQAVSCAWAGNCSAGGDYTAIPGGERAFVVNEVHGVWGKAVEVPGTAALTRAGTP